MLTLDSQLQLNSSPLLSIDIIRLTGKYGTMSRRVFLSQIYLRAITNDNTQNNNDLIGRYLYTHVQDFKIPNYNF